MITTIFIIMFVLIAYIIYLTYRVAKEIEELEIIKYRVVQLMVRNDMITFEDKSKLTLKQKNKTLKDLDKLFELAIKDIAHG